MVPPGDKDDTDDGDDPDGGGGQMGSSVEQCGPSRG